MSHFENSFKKNFTENIIEDSQQFISILKIWDIIVRFARVHNFPLPVSLLKFLANQNHWFEFTLVCDVFAYPLNQVITLLLINLNFVLKKKIMYYIGFRY